jgi:homospermidine synthase
LTSRLPDDRAGWAKLMKKVGVKGVHIAERDTQRSKTPEPSRMCSSIHGRWKASSPKGLQPAELGWGTHEKWKPKNAKSTKKAARRRSGSTSRRGHARAHMVPDARAAIRLSRHPQRGDLDRRLFTVRDKKGKVTYRPTCHYAYHPCNNAVLSLHEMFGRRHSRNRTSR